TGCALGGVAVLVLVGRFGPSAESSGYHTNAYHVRSSHPDKLAAKKLAKPTAGRAEAQSGKPSVEVATMAEALSETSGGAEPQPAGESVRPQDPAPVVSKEPDGTAIAKTARRHESAQWRRSREARAERRKSAKALARARQRDLDQPLPTEALSAFETGPYTTERAP